MAKLTMNITLEIEADDNFPTTIKVFCDGKEITEPELVDHGRSTERQWELPELISGLELYLVQSLG